MWLKSPIHKQKNKNMADMILLFFQFVYTLGIIVLAVSLSTVLLLLFSVCF
jgi:hypothetical protein